MTLSTVFITTVCELLFILIIKIMQWSVFCIHMSIKFCSKSFPSLFYQLLRYIVTFLNHLEFNFIRFIVENHWSQNRLKIIRLTVQCLYAPLSNNNVLYLISWFQTQNDAFKIGIHALQMQTTQHDLLFPSPSYASWFANCTCATDGPVAMVQWRSHQCHWSDINLSD